MTASLVPRPSPPPVWACSMKKQREKAWGFLSCGMWQHRWIIGSRFRCRDIFSQYTPFLFSGEMGVYLALSSGPAQNLGEGLVTLAKIPVCAVSAVFVWPGPFPDFWAGPGDEASVYQPARWVIQRSTLFMMTAVAIRKTGIISGCALGNQPVSMTNFDNGATYITSGDKRWPV